MNVKNPSHWNSNASESH